jgi:hypothetical protein
MVKKTETKKTETENEEYTGNSALIGYVTSDGQAYVPLIISLNALNKVLNGERAVTTVSQLQD